MLKKNEVDTKGMIQYWYMPDITLDFIYSDFCKAYKEGKRDYTVFDGEFLTNDDIVSFKTKVNQMKLGLDKDEYDLYVSEKASLLFDSLEEGIKNNNETAKNNYIEGMLPLIDEEKQEEWYGFVNNCNNDRTYNALNNATRVMLVMEDGNSENDVLEVLNDVCEEGLFDEEVSVPFTILVVDYFSKDSKIFKMVTNQDSNSEEYYNGVVSTYAKRK